MAGQRTAQSSIRMGEMAVASDGCLRTLLGSCIGVALYDSKQKVGGLAHVVLPDSRGNQDTPGKYADTAVPQLIEQLSELASRPLRLSAKIAGGANMFASSSAMTVGEQNLVAIEQVLDQHRVLILDRHCGGVQGRRMTLDVLTGKIQIEIVGETTIEI